MDSKTGLPLDLAGQQHLDDNLQARKRKKKIPRVVCWCLRTLEFWYYMNISYFFLPIPLSSDKLVKLYWTVQKYTTKIIYKTENLVNVLFFTSLLELSGMERSVSYKTITLAASYDPVKK